MTTALFQHARAHLACNYNPFTRQYYQIPRITGSGGVFSYFTSNFHHFDLPTVNYKYHVYEVNLYNLQILGMDSAFKRVWINLSDLFKANGLRYRLMDSTGRIMHLGLCYARVNSIGTLLLAVPIIDTFGLNYDQFYLEIFKTDYYTVNTTILPTCYTGKISVLNDIVTANTRLTSITSANTYTSGAQIFINGCKADTLANISIGSYYEIIYEPTIYKVVDFKLSTLPSFKSTLDAINKYLLHYDGSDTGIIEHPINIDVFLFDATTGIGYYLGHNADSFLRLLTHKDYSLSVNTVSGYLSLFTESGSLNNLHIRLHVHRAAKTFAKDSYGLRLDYLTQLTGTVFYNTLLTQSLVPEWNAARLEASAVANIMTNPASSVTQLQAENAYGYDQAVTALGGTMVATDGITPVVVPTGYDLNATAFEYDVNGILLGWNTIVGAISIYAPTYTQTRTIEFIEGIASNVLDEIYDTDQVTVQSPYNYRAYVKFLNNSNYDTNWHDVTDQGLLTISNSIGHWDSSLNNYQTKRLVRSDRKFLCYSTSISAYNGNYVHQVQYSKLVNGVAVSSGVNVPLLDYEFYLNGHPLVANVDYVFNHPVFTLTSSTYLSNSNTLTVRGTGFCKQDLSIRNDDEAGFVFDGIISLNQAYGPWLDTTNRIIAGGKMIADNYALYEERSTTTPLINGVPYSIKRKLTPLLGNIIANDPYKLFDASKAFETKMIAYIDQYISENATNTPRPINPITNKYRCYSPLLAALIANIQSGSITEAALASVITTTDMLNLVSPYSYLINYEMSLKGVYDPLYVILQPTVNANVVTLSANAFRVIKMCNQYYLNNAVDINTFIAIST